MPRGKAKAPAPAVQAQVTEVLVTQKDADEGDDTPTQNPFARAIARAIADGMVAKGIYTGDGVEVEVENNQVSIIAGDWARLGIDLDEEAVIWLCNWRVGNEMGPIVIKLPEV